jgi:hypothetical protein
MSLSSLLAAARNSYGYGASVDSSVTATTQAALDAAAKAATTTTPGATTGSGVSISIAAKIAAAEKTDNAKDFTALAKDVRSTLDAQYAAAKTAGQGSGSGARADLSEASGRALAAIILDKTGQFSGTEIAAAKVELKTRGTSDFSSAMRGGSAMTGLAAYNRQLVSNYDSMSQEERDARGWTAGLRSGAEAFVDATSTGAGGTSSLFELINDTDDDSSSSTGSSDASGFGF